MTFKVGDTVLHYRGQRMTVYDVGTNFVGGKYSDPFGAEHFWTGTPGDFELFPPPSVTLEAVPDSDPPPVTVVQLNGDDTIVFTVPQRLADLEAKALTAQFEEMFPDQAVLVIHSGGRLSIVKAPDGN